MEILRLENVSKFYKSTETVSVGMKNVTASFEIGEFVAITGESGSGKSTLLNVISGLDGYEEGEVYHYGEETSHFTIADWEKYRSAYVGFVFQNYNIIDSYTVYQNVLFALEVQGYPKKDRRKRALELIDKVGLSSHKNHKAAKLSGGQKQRAVIARALAKDTPIIVADEPTGNLDSQSAKQVMELLYQLSKDKLVIVVTHDYAQVEPYATRKIKMHDGTIVEDTQLKKQEISHEPIKVEPKKTSLETLLRVSVRNVFSMPKRFLFMLILQVLVIGIFTLVYSAEMQSIRETSITQSSTFVNVPETRLLVERRDGNVISTEEINNFKKNSNVLAVYENSELFYNYTNLSIQQTSNAFGGYGYYVSATDSAIVLNKNDVNGKLPVAINEVVISDYYNAFSVGDVINVFPSQYSYYDEKNQDFQDLFAIYGEYKVVGIDKLNRNTIYFSEAYLKQSQEAINEKNERLAAKIKETAGKNLYLYFNNESYEVVYDEALTLSYDLQMPKNKPTDVYEVMENSLLHFQTCFYNTCSTVTKTASIAYFEGESLGIINIKKELYDEIIDAAYYDPIGNALGGNQFANRNLISVEVESFNKGDKFLNAVDNDIYKVYYPANIKQPGGEILLLITKILAYLLLFCLGMFLYTIVHAVSKNVMSSRKKDFAIYRSIGTNQKDIAIMVVVEQVILSMIAFVVTLIGLNLLGLYFATIRSAMTYMGIKDYIILITVFLLFSIWLGLRFNKKVFDQSVITILTTSKEGL